MTAGLLAKTALFPLHLWLPPAHANAPAAASAVLSGLVVKGSFFLVVRLWFDVLPARRQAAIPARCSPRSARRRSCSAACWRLRQARLKLLIAYSTVAQIGYLFLMFPLVAGDHPWSADAWTGGVMQALSHAFAKAAMFLAAGLVAEPLGHDRIAELRRHRPGDADDRLRLRPRRAVADGAAAERRLRGEMAAAEGLGRKPANGGGRWSCWRAGCWPAATSIACSPRRWRDASVADEGAGVAAARASRWRWRSCAVLLASRRIASSTCCRSAGRPQAVALQ